MVCEMHGRMPVRYCSKSAVGLESMEREYVASLGCSVVDGDVREVMARESEGRGDLYTCPMSRNGGVMMIRFVRFHLGLLPRTMKKGCCS